MTITTAVDSGALTLQQRAQAYAEEVAAASAERSLRENKERHEARILALRNQLRDRFDIRDGVTIREVNEHGDYILADVVAEVDGLTFAVRDLPHADSYRDRDRLHLLVPCARGCGKNLWVEAESLWQIHEALTRPQMHSFACLVQYDDEGEPTTDRSGNPLPPRGPKPPRLSPEEQARQAINLLQQAAIFAASAHNYVAELEDARALIKPAAIKRLMESGTATSATAAERIVESDPEYAAHRAKQRDGEVCRWKSLAAFEAVKLRAQLAVGLATADAMRIARGDGEGASE